MIAELYSMIIFDHWGYLCLSLSLYLHIYIYGVDLKVHVGILH
jgi:hypothetical protein